MSILFESNDDDDDDDDDLLVSQSRYTKFNQLMKWCENIWSFKWKKYCFSSCSLQFPFIHIRFHLYIRLLLTMMVMMITLLLPSLERYSFNIWRIYKESSSLVRHQFQNKIPYRTFSLSHSPLALVLLKHHYNIQHSLSYFVDL